MKKFLCLLVLCTGLGSTAANARSPLTMASLLLGAALPAAVHAQASTQVPAGAQTEVGFSPKQGARELVVKTINSAHSRIDMSAYSFTSADVTRALLASIKRGVKLRLMVDYKANFTGNSSKSRAAMSALVNAGAQVRSVDVYPILHDKYVIVDGQHLETGSFNYSRAADVSNSENVIVFWNAPAVSRQFTQHFEHNWSQGAVYSGR